eukprot:s826_g11.t1
MAEDNIHVRSWIPEEASKDGTLVVAFEVQGGREDRPKALLLRGCMARKHEEELFYALGPESRKVIRRKDEELLRARAVLADLSQLVEEGQLADEAAELLGNVAGMEYDELYDRCSQLEDLWSLAATSDPLW